MKGPVCPGGRGSCADPTLLFPPPSHKKLTISKVVRRTGGYTVEDFQELQNVLNSGHVINSNWGGDSRALVLWHFRFYLLFDFRFVKSRGGGWGGIQSITEFLLKEEKGKKGTSNESVARQRSKGRLHRKVEIEIFLTNSAHQALDRSRHRGIYRSVFRVR